MDTFEKEMAKKQLETLKSINRNLNYLGRKLEETNKILQKNGMAVFAELDTTTEPPSYGEQMAEEITQKCL